MIHMHNTLSSGLDQSTAGITKHPVSQARLDSFRNALSDAVSSTLERFGIDPNQVQVSITPSTSGAPSTTSTPPATSSPSTMPDSTDSANYNPFAQAAHENWSGAYVPAVSSPTSSSNTVTK